MWLTSWLCLSAVVAFAQGLSPATAAKAREGLEARENGRYEDAAKAFEAVVEAAPGFVAAHLNLGLTRHEQGEHAKAATAFEAALELDPDLQDVRRLLGYDLAAAGRFEEALEILERANQEEPARPETLYSLGLAYLRTGDHVQAIDWLERALQESPANAELLRLSAEAHASLARARQDELLRSAPESAPARIVMAQQATANRRYGEAIELYEAVLRSEPGRADVMVPLGDLYLEREGYARAEEVYRHEFDARPGYSLAAERWGEALLLLGRSAEAVGPLEQATKLDPSALSARGLLGKALADVGDLVRAAEVLSAVIASQPPPNVAARTHYQLGLIYRKMERAEDAREHLRVFQQLQEELLAEDDR